jgi:hypothetical protein
MHPLLVLAAFSIAALVLYGVVYGLLRVSSFGTLDADESDDRRPRAHC